MTWRTRKVTPAAAAREPVKEAEAAVAATRRVTRAAVLEMDPVKDLVPNLDPAKALDLVRTMDLAPVPRDTRAAVDTEIAMETAAVPRDIRVLVPAMALVKDLVLNLDPNLMMDTPEVAMAVETAEDLVSITEAGS